MLLAGSGLGGCSNLLDTRTISGEWRGHIVKVDLYDSRGNIHEAVGFVAESGTGFNSDDPTVAKTAVISKLPFVLRSQFGRIITFDSFEGRELDLRGTIYYRPIYSSDGKVRLSSERSTDDKFTSISSIKVGSYAVIKK